MARKRKRRDPERMTLEERREAFWRVVRAASEKYRMRLDVRPLIVSVPEEGLRDG